MSPPGKRDVPLHLRRQRKDSPSRLSRALEAPKKALDAPKTPPVGKIGEQLAADYLAAKGFLIMHRNWRSGRFTEIDVIVAKPNGVITFVEVKTRKAVLTSLGVCIEGYDQGLDAIDWKKRRKMIIAARSFAARYRETDLSCSFDVVIVMYRSALMQDGELHLEGVEILHIPEAFNST